MATFEQVGLCLQLIGNIYGLINNMRDNAAGYKRQVTAGNLTAAQIATIMQGDANQYVKRINWITDLATRNLTLLTNALAALGLTVADANSLKTTLTDVCNHTLAASLNNNTQINTEADYQLANLPTFERLW